MTTPAGTGALPNLYHKRAVAASSSKPCTICYKSTSVVLITPDNRDFFYVCAGHLNDKGFATPAPGEGRDLKKEREEEFQREIENVKKEYEEKMKRRREKKEAKNDEKKDKDDTYFKEEKKDATERDDKIAELEKKKAADPSDPAATDPAKQADDAKKEAESARIFTLHRSFFQMRVTKLQQAAAARRRAEQLRNPAFFPAVPGAAPKGP